MISEPPLGWRHVGVTDRRTAEDFAGVRRWLAEDLHPGAGRLVLGTDTRSTHDPGRLSEAFEPARARRIAARRGWHDTPGRGLNVAACEPAALASQCRDRRIGSVVRLKQVVEAWVGERNGREVGAGWRFATADARVKLRRLDPAPQKG